MKTKNDAPVRKVNQFKEMARIVVRHHFGSNPRRITYKSSGLTNFVFAVNHSEGKFVIRISPDPQRLNLFIKEQWAQDRVRQIGVPSAEILEVGMDVIPFPFMISRQIDGIEATNHPERMKIIREMGHYAAMINSIPTSGFGGTFDWSSNLLSRNETWQEYLEKELNFESKLDILEKHRVFSGNQVKSLNKIFAQALKLKPTSVLNHGDLRLKNVIVAESGKINAVIDWEGCLSHMAPPWELSIALHDLWIDEKQYFLDGYGIKESVFQEYTPLIKAFNIINYAHVIQDLADRNESNRLEQYRTRLGGYLDLYSLPGY